MLSNLYNNISSPAVTIIAISIMLVIGFAMTRITKLLKLPNATAYIVAGILIGPFCLDLIPSTVVSGTDFLSDIALAFISFSVGEFLRFSTLKKSGVKSLVITAIEAVTVTLFVFILTYGILKLDIVFSITLSALSSVTAITSTAMTIRQTKSHGSFVDTLLQVIALDDVLGLVAFSIALSLSGVLISDGGSFSVTTVIIPIATNLGVTVVGGLFGFLLKLLMPKKRTTDNRLIILISILFLFCGICTSLGVSPLLGCMAMGMIYINVTDDDKLFKQINYFSPPILLLFFVRSGVNFQIDLLFSSASTSGTVPIIVIALLYFAIRMVGKYCGAFLGSTVAKVGKSTRNYLALGLVPQGGVAIGLAATAARTLGGSAGENLQTIILASSILYELIGPACAKLSLYLSGSYSNKIEDVAPVPITENGVPKREVDILIDRIQKIREEIENEERLEASPEEQAFLDASDEQYEALCELQKRRWRRK